MSIHGEVWSNTWRCLEQALITDAWCSPACGSAVAPTPPCCSPHCPQAFFWLDFQAIFCSLPWHALKWVSLVVWCNVPSARAQPLLGKGTSAASGDGRPQSLCCQLFSHQPQDKLQGWWASVRQHVDFFFVKFGRDYLFFKKKNKLDCWLDLAAARFQGRNIPSSSCNNPGAKLASCSHCGQSLA